MKCCKLILMVVCFVLVFSVCGTAFADTIDLINPSIPSSAKSYSAGTCQYGFTTSNYMSKPSGGFPGKVYVSNNYVTWDGYSEFDQYEYVKPKDQNGEYLKGSWGMVYTGWGGTINYSILTMSAKSTSTRLYLRIENPGYTTGETNYNIPGYPVIQNIATSGKFWF